MIKGEFLNLTKIAQITDIPKITAPKSNDYRPVSIVHTSKSLQKSN